jgi:hypothetical protein
MSHTWALIGLLGLAAGAVAGCYVVSPNAYPAYAPPPPYAAPPPASPSGPAPSTGAATPSTGPRSPGGAATGRRCETVLVEGHWETLVRSGGQSERVWVPARNIQECR